MANILLIQQTVDSYSMIKSAMSYDAHTLHVIHNSEIGGWPNTPDLIILQTAESIEDDVCFCEQLRSLPQFTKTPILVLSYTKSAHCTSKMLDGGCDDVVCMPTVDRMLAARVRALLRRKPQPRKQDSLILNSQTKTAWLGERSLGLTNIEFALLETLCSHSGQQLSSAALLQQVWHYPPGKGDTALVRNHVRNLRRKLEADPNHPRILLCFQGRGYSISTEIQQY